MGQSVFENQEKSEPAMSDNQEQPAVPLIHYAPYGPNANGTFNCGAHKGGYTDKPNNVTCNGCKAESPGLWPEATQQEQPAAKKLPDSQLAAIVSIC